MVIIKENGNSDWLETNLGVPQGSALSPLLFCIYVNDLRDILDGRTIKHIFYANDLQIYLHTIKDKILESISRLSHAAQMVSEWAGNSGLRHNAGKTQAIVFGSKKNVNDIKERGYRRPIFLFFKDFFFFIEIYTNIHYNELKTTSVSPIFEIL